MSPEMPQHCSAKWELNWNPLEKVRSFTGIVSDHRQAPSQISQKFAGLMSQRAHRFHSDWDESMGGSNARILDMFPGCCGACRRGTLRVKYEVAKVSTMVTSQKRITIKLSWIILFYVNRNRCCRLCIAHSTCNSTDNFIKQLHKMLLFPILF